MGKMFLGQCHVINADIVITASEPNAVPEGLEKTLLEPAG